MVKAGFDFTPWADAHTRIMYIPINKGIEIIGGVNFNTQKTLSFGYIRRTIGRDTPNNNYHLTPPFEAIAGWPGTWEFVVNYRVRCENHGMVSAKNVAYSDLIASGFVTSGWSLIPHFINTHHDQGIDFFKPIPQSILSDYLPPLDAEDNPIFNEGIALMLPQIILNWIDATIAEAKGLI
jgi:hypothetical protein